MGSAGGMFGAGHGVLGICWLWAKKSALFEGLAVLYQTKVGLVYIF